MLGPFFIQDQIRYDPYNLEKRPKIQGCIKLPKCYNDIVSYKTKHPYCFVRNKKPNGNWRKGEDTNGL